MCSCARPTTSTALRRGVILPGGESTTQLKFLRKKASIDASAAICSRWRRDFRHLRRGNPAGPRSSQSRAGFARSADISVLRNGYGRQLASDVHFGPPNSATSRSKWFSFARPSSIRIGRNVEILAEVRGKSGPGAPGPHSAATFHPELTSDTAVHQYFLNAASQTAEADSGPTNFP